jgi:methylmalonyl-CoA mutase
VSGVYQSEFGQDPQIEQVRRLTDEFARKHGRVRASSLPRWARMATTAAPKVVATAYADLGFDVDIGPLFQQPDEAARMAAENDVHVVGISSLAGGHKTLLVQTCRRTILQRRRGGLRKIGRKEILTSWSWSTPGGVIPPQDYDFLKKNGAAAVFGPGTVHSGCGQGNSGMRSGWVRHDHCRNSWGRPVRDRPAVDGGFLPAASSPGCG